MSPDKVISMECDDMTYISGTINLVQNSSITYEYDDGAGKVKTANYHVKTYQIELRWFESDFVTITYTEHGM